MFDYIPEYNPHDEQRGLPREGEVITAGIIVGRGETQKVVDPETVYKLASIGCSDREISEWFGISSSTLRFNFSSYMTKARSSLKQRLRRAQLKAAVENLNPALLIWLGRNMLDQSETVVNAENERILPWITETDISVDTDTDAVN